MIREETVDWNDFNEIPEKMPEFSLIWRILLGADSAVYATSFKTLDTNENKRVTFANTVDPFFVSSKNAVLYCTHFCVQ